MAVGVGEVEASPALVVVDLSGTLPEGVGPVLERTRADALEDRIEVFLVEPSINRGSATNAGEVYTEVIGVTQAGGGSTAGQVIRRDVPYLVK